MKTPEKEKTILDEFNVLRDALRDWPGNSLPEVKFQDSCCERLRRSLLSVKEGDAEKVGKGDLLGLIRHYLLSYQGVRNSRKPVSQRVPTGDLWPDEADYRDAGFEVSREGDDFRISCKPWAPRWLWREAGDDKDPLEAVIRGDSCLPEIKGDLKADLGFIEMLGYPEYRSKGQKAAIRAAFCMQPGSTLVVNLPTGTGKSLVAYAPALEAARKGKLSVFIVPTISLALDQEKQVQNLLEQKRKLDGGGGEDPEDLQFAWYGDLKEEDRNAIIDRIDFGNQKILITSPECLGSNRLSAKLETLAKTDRLAYFVIDEAHMVDQWGGCFRPDFQSIAGLRNRLLEQSSPRGEKFRTLLMTATLTESCFELLKDFFGESDLKPDVGKIDVVAAVHLRPEPSYWIEKCRDSEEQKERILDLLRHLPRPFILYSSTRADVTAWHRVLRDDLGIRRCDEFSGDTGPGARRRIIDQWGNRELDAISANTAFGLGIDQGDVRAVVHACVPESLDRYYQEVGRGGRDGKACVSFLFHKPDDLHIGKKLASETYIGEEKGWARWDQLNKTGEGKGGGRYEVDLEKIPPYLDWSSEENEDWNLRTILLMHRAGVIEIDCSPPAFIKREVGESKEEFKERCEREFAERGRPVSIRRIDSIACRDKEAWEKKVAPKREELYQRNRENWRMVEEDLLSGTASVCDLLKSLYSFQVNDEGSVEVRTSCGGCPGCRSQQRSRVLEYYPEPCIPSALDCTLKGPLRKIFGEELTVYVSYPCPSDKPSELDDWNEDILDVIGLCVEQGIREVATGEDLHSLKRFRKLYQKSDLSFVINRDIESEEGDARLKVPRLSVLGPDFAGRKFPRHLRRYETQGVIFFPETMEDPVTSGVDFKSSILGCLNIDEFKNKLRL